MNSRATLTNALATNASLAIQGAIGDPSPETLRDALVALAHLEAVLRAWQAEVTP